MSEPMTAEEWANIGFGDKDVYDRIALALRERELAMTALRLVQFEDGQQIEMTDGTRARIADLLKGGQP